MNKKRIVSLFLAFLCVLTFILTGCEKKDANIPSTLIKTDNPLSPYKYEPPITLTACQMAYAGCVYNEGDSAENNVWTRSIEENVGIKLAFEFQSLSSDAFEVKINAAFASSSLPEICALYTSLFFRAADKGLLKDITKEWNQYACDEIKSDARLANNRGYLSAVKDGKLYAVTNATGEGIANWDSGIMWYRQDILQQLGATVPKTMDEYWAFAENASRTLKTKEGRDVYGIYVDKTLATITALGNAYGAYNDIWIEDENGELIRSDISEKWIPVLKKLNSFYNKGVIDPEFVSYDRGAASQTVTRGQVASGPMGVFAPDGCIGASVQADTSIKWINTLMPTVNGKQVKIQSASRIGSFVAMNAHTTHPEACILLQNYIYKALEEGDPALWNLNGIDTYRYIQGFYMNNPYDRCVATEQIADVLNNKKDASTLRGKALSFYTQMKPWVDSKDPAGWPMYAIYGLGGSFNRITEIKDNGYYYSDRLWGPELPNWKEYGSDLATKRVTNFMAIICGQQGSSVEDGFIQWVQYFNQNGGQASTYEINDWWKLDGKLGFYGYKEK